jgi:hypothetical protein
LEEELMPLIQSEVNADMRDLQMDSQLFMTPTGTGIAKAYLPPLSPHLHYVYTGNTSSASLDTEEVDVSEAARRCVAIIQPLFFHWADLPQHRDQVRLNSPSLGEISPILLTCTRC